MHIQLHLVIYLQKRSHGLGWLYGRQGSEVLQHIHMSSPPPKCPKTVGCARGLIRRDADGDVSKMIGKSVRQEEHKNGREINTYHTDDVRRFFELLM